MMSESENDELNDNLSHASNTAVVDERATSTQHHRHSLASKEASVAAATYEQLLMHGHYRRVQEDAKVTSSEPPPSLPDSTRSTPLSGRQEKALSPCRAQLWMPLAGAVRHSADLTPPKPTSAADLNANVKIRCVI